MAQILAQSTTLLSRYEQAAQRHPISTKVATCFVGFAAGDVVAQAISRPVRVSITTDGILTGTESLRQKVEVDFVRALRMALFGALIAAPQMHVFHGWMERVRFLFAPRALSLLTHRMCTAAGGLALFCAQRRAMYCNPLELACSGRIAVQIEVNAVLVVSPMLCNTELTSGVHCRP